MLLSDDLGIAGLAVSALGFGLTVWQLVKTANAAVATKDAIVAANKRMVLNHLLVLLPQLTTIEADLDTAIADNDRNDAVRALIKFSHTANQVAALLDAQSAEDKESALIAELRAAAKNASASKGVLVSGPTKSLKVVLSAVDAEIGSVTSTCVGLTTKYQAKVA